MKLCASRFVISATALWNKNLEANADKLTMRKPRNIEEQCFETAMQYILFSIAALSPFPLRIPASLINQSIDQTL